MKNASRSAFTPERACDGVSYTCRSCVDPAIHSVPAAEHGCRSNGRQKSVGIKQSCIG